MRRNLVAEQPGLAKRLGSRLLEWYVRNEVLARELGAAPDLADEISDDDRAKLRVLGYAE